MKRCLPKSRIPTPRPVHHWGLRTSPQVIPRKSALKQLSNTELLEIVLQIKQDTTFATKAQSGTHKLDSQNHDISTQIAPPLTARPSQLPQSPLTDPNLIAARLRHRSVKPLPSGSLSPFQSRLQKNPFAIALATPPRLCIVTGVRLPSYFQIPFGLATHPKTGAPWHLPKPPTQAVSDPGDDEISSVTSESTLPCALESEDSSKQLRSPMRTLSSTHFLASRQVLAHISSLHPSKYERLMPQRWKHDASVKLFDIVWREDMDIFVLEILRRNLSKELMYLASRPTAYIAPCKTYESINDHRQVAVVLWLSNNPNKSMHDERASGEETSFDCRQIGPPSYAMHYYKTHCIPCYDLAALLGPIQLRALRDSRPDHFNDQLALMKLKRNTVGVQLALWKLLGYMVQSRKCA